MWKCGLYNERAGWASAPSVERSAANDSDRDAYSGWVWRPAWWRASFQNSNADSVAHRNADGDRYSSAFTHRDADSQAQANPNPNSDSAARATACLRPRARRAASFANRHRPREHEPDAGQPDL